MLASLIILATALEGLSSQPFSKLTDLTYFHSTSSNGNKLENEYGQKISGALQIYLMRFYYIDHILLTTERGDSGVFITLEVKDAAKNVNKSCSKKSTNEFECKICTQNVAINGMLSNLMKLELYGHAVNFHKYLGCFPDSFFVGLEHSDRFHDCESSCWDTTLYGLTPNEKCVCINSLEKSTSSLELCNIECPSKRFIFCGGIDHISVYTKNEVRNLLLTPSSDTVMRCKKTGSSCGVCDDGRKTEFCSVFDCSINNGSCGTKKCEFLGLKDDLKLGVCHCPPGYYLNETGSCLDVDECNTTVSPCPVTACLNTEGSYLCDCKPGFMRLDDLHCGDYNECRNKTICDVETTICKNLYGTFECACKKGFERKVKDLRSCTVETLADRFSEALFDLTFLLVAFVLVLMSTLFVSVYVIVSKRR